MRCFCLLLLLTLTRGMLYERCQLARELLNKHHFPPDQIADWVCLAFSESSYRTHVTGPANSDGSHDHGLFQINDRYWCSPPVQYNECGMKCSDLRDDDITDDVRCVRLIFKRHGFSAWNGWKRKCKGKDLTRYVRNCF